MSSLKPIDVTQKIDDLSRIIRKKYLALKLGKSETDETLDRLFKPITKSLEKIKNNSIKFSAVSPKSTPLSPPKLIENRHIDDEEVNTDRKREPLEVKPNLNIPSVQFLPTELVGELNTSASPDLDNDNDSMNVSEMYSSPVYKDYLEAYPELAQEYIHGFLHDSISKDFDTTYGVSHDPITNKWTIGNSVIEFAKNTNDLIIKNKTYVGTKGLYELLFMKIPDPYNAQDLNNYANIIFDSSLHKRNYDPSEITKGTNLYKYRAIIKPLLDKSRARSFSGSGYQTHDEDKLLQYNQKPIEYIYWDDINELVDRLRLLVASQQAGNSSHNNEILSIISELKEAGIIY